MFPFVKDVLRLQGVDPVFKYLEGGVFVSQGFGLARYENRLHLQIAELKVKFRHLVVSVGGSLGCSPCSSAQSAN